MVTVIRRPVLYIKYFSVGLVKNQESWSLVHFAPHVHRFAHKRRCGLLSPAGQQLWPLNLRYNYLSRNVPLFGWFYHAKFAFVDFNRYSGCSFCMIFLPILLAWSYSVRRHSGLRLLVIRPYFVGQSSVFIGSGIQAILSSWPRSYDSLRTEITICKHF